MFHRTATTQKTWEEKVAVGMVASHKGEQCNTLLIAHYVLVPSKGSTHQPGYTIYPWSSASANRERFNSMHSRGNRAFLLIFSTQVYEQGLHRNALAARM
jgi:hypothetical protein